MDLAVDLKVRNGDPRRYRAVEKLGGGSFGDILAAVNENDPEDWIALKFESWYRAQDIDRVRQEPSMVLFEWRVCHELQTTPGSGPCPCPEMYGCEPLGEHHVLLMELLGPNLRDLAHELGTWPLPARLVLAIGCILVARLEQLHSRGFIHRDLKPENVAMRLWQGPNEGPIPCLLIIDYALAVRYADPNDIAGTHLPPCDDEDIAGTHRYMAIHAQEGQRQSRRSDLEGLAYVLVYLARGNLPWQREEDPATMARMKRDMKGHTLCENLPSCLAEFVERTRALGFAEEPNYYELQMLLAQGLVNQALEFKAPKIREMARSRLRTAYFKRLRLAQRFPPTNGHTTSKPKLDIMSIFVKHDSKGEASELFASQPLSLADLDNQAERPHFFFQACRRPLRGTAHIVVGSVHFYGFLTEQALMDAYQDVSQSEVPTHVQQILVFSLHQRDMVLRKAEIPDYDVRSGKTLREWNLRGAFWSPVMLTNKRKQ